MLAQGFGLVCQVDPHPQFCWSETSPQADALKALRLQEASARSNADKVEARVDSCLSRGRARVTRTAPKRGDSHPTPAGIG